MSDTLKAKEQLSAIVDLIITTAATQAQAVAA